MKKTILVFAFLTLSFITKAQSKSDIQYFLHNFCNEFFYECFYRKYQNIDVENYKKIGNTITANGKISYKNFWDIVDKNNFEVTIIIYSESVTVAFYKQSWSPFRDSDEYYWELCEKEIPLR